ncbi:MAG: DNA pilot protein [Microviridae sp.]|nr:MAG: DNA pilot protein [Microviridae sp.]
MYEMDSTGSWQEAGGASDAGDIFSSAGSIASMATGNPLWSLGSSVIGGMFGGSSAKSQNKQQIKLAREQMAFQERMSNTAHQREVVDLRAAGLNPILSSTKGLGGSSTPQGAMPTVQNTGDAAIRGAASALALQTGQAQVDLLKAQTAKTLAETASENQRPGNIAADTGLKAQQNNLAGIQQSLVAADINNRGINTALTRVQEALARIKFEFFTPLEKEKLETEVNILKEEFKTAQRRGELDATEFGKLMGYVERLLSPFSISMGVHKGMK